MRILAGLVVAFLSVSSAHAQKLFAPVQIIREVEVCGMLEMLKHREHLRAEQRSEAVEGLQGLDPFLPEGNGTKCFLARSGKYMFFDHTNGPYACVRPRPGADCLWLRSDALGENYELFPGRKPGQGNKGISCEAWGKAIQQSSDILERDRKAIFAGTPRNTGEKFVQGMVKDTMNMFTGSATSAQQNRDQLCRFNLRNLQESARRLTGYSACPHLDAGGVRDKLQVSYDGNMKLFRECL